MSSARAVKRGHIVKKPVWKEDGEGNSYIVDYIVSRKTKRGKI